MKHISPLSGAVSALLLAASCSAAGNNPFLGDWALTLPNGGAGWLGVEETEGGLKANMLWGGGSVFPLASATIQDNHLLITRLHQVQRKGANGKTAKTSITETMTGILKGERIEFVTSQPRENGGGEIKAEFSGYRQPTLPPAPDLSKVKFGRPVQLFNGKDLTGWKLTDPGAANGWSVKDGILSNQPEQAQGQTHKRFGNLRTEQEFEDFNLTLETRVSEKSNSGVYLRGIYEVQVINSFAKPLDSHNMGALYSRIRPTESAEQPVGQWQSLDITLVDRHVTVVLNGKKIINNQPLRGCTGGALWSDVMRPGPIYLQGDHTDVQYRNLVLRPVIKEL